MIRAASGLPFDDIRNLLSDMPVADEGARQAAVARQGQLVKPAGALGRLEEIAVFIAGWQGRAIPAVNRPTVAVFAATHGIAGRDGVGDTAEATKQMVATFTAGKAAVNQICGVFGAGLRVFDLALDVPAPDIVEADAFSEAECAATMAFGMEALAGEPDLLCLGELGLGNGLVAAAMCNALYGGSAQDWVDSEMDDPALAGRIETVRRAVERAGRQDDPLEVLRRLGGRELAAIAGAILAARMQRVPVVLDGFVVTAAAAVLHALNPRALDHCLAGHVSAEGAHRALLERLGLRPMLDLGLHLGEGTGAALAIGVIKSALACHSGMATREDAPAAVPGGAA